MPLAPPRFSDEELARQSQAGSLAAFEEVVSRHETAIYRYLAACCGNTTDARELTQTTFVTAYRCLHQFALNRAFAPWLFTIARRKFLDHCRAARPALEQGAAPEAWDTDAPATLLARREDAQNLWARLRHLLPPAQFDALWLKYREEMSIQDIARALRRTQTSVKVLLFRARQTLLKTSDRILSREPTDPRDARPDSRARESHRPGLGSDWQSSEPAPNLSSHLT